ncbi:MAG: cytochrome c peroxidase [Methylococcales bacterium]
MKKRMNRATGFLTFTAIIITGLITACSTQTANLNKAESPNDLHQWLLPATPPHPEGNAPTPERVELGKMLFFDPRLSRDKNMSCATCHNPSLGWADGLPKGRGFKSNELGRATPTVINTAYNSIQMWDGRKKDLEDQAMGPLQADVEMNTDFEHLFVWLNENSGYKAAFAKAYPGEPIAPETAAKAIASFERTVISNNSPFDAWIKGDKFAMTKQQIRGFKLFSDKEKADCAVCHSAPNFTDDGFHNIGLASFGEKDTDLGRFHQRPLRLMKGAFKTPTLRDIALTAPYFHDGSSNTLMDVVEHYANGGENKTNLSPNLSKIKLNQQEKEDLVAFLGALTSKNDLMTLPLLP